MPLVRAAAALLALVAAGAVAAALDERLLLHGLRTGFAYGYRLPELVLLAAGSAVVWLCGCAVRRALRPGWDAVLLTGPVVLGALLAEVLVPIPDDPNAYGYFELVDPEGPPYLWVDWLLVLAAVAVGVGVPTWALIRSRRGTT